MHKPFPTLAMMLLVATLSTACGAERAQSPEEAYEDFFALSHALAREPQEALQQELFERIDQASRDALTARAEQLNARLPEGARVAPHALLTGRDTPLGTRISKMEIVDRTETGVTLRVELDAGEAHVTLRRDGDRWLVALPPLGAEATP